MVRLEEIGIHIRDIDDANWSIILDDVIPSSRLNDLTYAVKS